MGRGAVAAPGIDRRGQVRFALNSSSHVSSVTLERIVDEYVPIMKAAARNIAAVLP